MRYRLDVSPRAEAELEGIFEYSLTRWSREQAETYTDALIDAFDAIAARAVPWRPIPSDLGVDGFRYRCGRHVIYWRATETVVTILELLHERMDQGSRLAE